MKNLFLIIFLFVSVLVNAQEYRFKCTLHKDDGSIVYNCDGHIYFDTEMISHQKILLIDVENPYNKKKDHFYDMIETGSYIAVADEADILADTDVPMIKRGINFFSHRDDDRTLEIYVARAKSGGKFQYIGFNYNSSSGDNGINVWVEVPYTLDNFLGIYRVLDVAKETLHLNQIRY